MEWAEPHPPWQIGFHFSANFSFWVGSLQCVWVWTERECHPPLVKLPCPARQQVYCPAVDLEEGRMRSYVWKKPACGVQWASDTSLLGTSRRSCRAQDGRHFSVSPSWCCTCQHLCFYCSVWVAGTAEIETMTSTSQRNVSLSPQWAILVQCVARGGGLVTVDQCLLRTRVQKNRDLCCNA